MKRLFALLMALVLVLSLAACGGSEKKEDTAKDDPATEAVTEAATEEAKETKEDLLAVAGSLSKEDIDKAGENKAFANSLVGNVYKITVEVDEVRDDYIRATSFKLGDGTYYSHYQLAANVYLPQEDLIDLGNGDDVSLVAKVTEIESEKKEGDAVVNLDDFSVNVLVFGTAYIAK